MDSLLNKNEIWEPSNEVAKKTKHYLETVGNYSVTIAPDVEPLPGIESWETNVSLWEIPLKKLVQRRNLVNRLLGATRL